MNSAQRARAIQKAKIPVKIIFIRDANYAGGGYYVDKPFLKKEVKQ